MNRIDIVYHKGEMYYIRNPEGKKKVFAYLDKECKEPAYNSRGSRLTFFTKTLRKYNK